MSSNARRKVALAQDTLFEQALARPYLRHAYAVEAGAVCGGRGVRNVLLAGAVVGQCGQCDPGRSLIDQHSRAAFWNTRALTVHWPRLYR